MSGAGQYAGSGWPIAGASHDGGAVMSSMGETAASDTNACREGRRGGAGLGAASVLKSLKKPRRSCALAPSSWVQFPSSCEPPHSHIIGLVIGIPISRL